MFSPRLVVFKLSRLRLPLLSLECFSFSRLLLDGEGTGLGDARFGMLLLFVLDREDGEVAALLPLLTSDAPFPFPSRFAALGAGLLLGLWFGEADCSMRHWHETPSMIGVDSAVARVAPSKSAKVSCK
jgi:hypothetical protein